MSESNQNSSEQSIVYNANTALAFFKQFGSTESVKAGEILFAKGKKSVFSFLQPEKTYLLYEGDIELQTVSLTPEKVRKGQLFGAYTPINTRHFTATATSAAKLLSLTESQLLTGLKNKPDFLLMLMGLFAAFLRRPSDQKNEVTQKQEPSEKKEALLSSKMIKELIKKLGDDAITSMPAQRVIFKEGGTAMLMYVILKGEVSTRVDNKIVNKCGAGDIIGEIALVDQKPRTASVIAETHTSLLAINRQTLLELIETMPDFGIILLKTLASRSFLHSSDPSPNDDWDWL